MLFLCHCLFDLLLCMKSWGTKTFVTRFTVQKIREVVPKFSDDERQWIIDSGHGSLLSICEFFVPIKLVKWMVKHIDPLLCEFRFGEKVIIFDRLLVCNILGHKMVQPL